MSNQPLPDYRESTTQKVVINGTAVYFTIGFYDTDRTKPGELFISIKKTGSQERAILDEVARLASKLLQHGLPVEELGTMWHGTIGVPAGPVQGDGRIKNCTGVLDYMGRHLLVYYCGREDLAHVKVEAL